MEIYSPKRGDITKFKLNVLKSDMEKNNEKTSADEQNPEPKIRFEKPKIKKDDVKSQTGNIFNKAVDLCYGAMKRFFEAEEVV
ncbi:MAG TPA: hypothetical protein PKI01_08470 [Bacteroidales bacterium]|nr:hypothetical protein [Bacteroidales bacterium]